MLNRARLAAWIDAYEGAWRSAGTDALADLFTQDACYRMSPFEAPHTGLDAIRRLWDRERDGPDEEFTMSSEIVAVDGDTGVARVDVTYGRTGQRYLDIWIARFAADGRCREFEEWPLWPQIGHAPGSPGRT